MKPVRAKGFDPRKRKSRNNARLRKLMRNGSDKSARRRAHDTKRFSNRKVRKQSAPSVGAADLQDTSIEDAKVAQRTKKRHWGSYNAAATRKWRTLERRLLDENPVTGVKGRARSGPLLKRHFANADDKTK